MHHQSPHLNCDDAINRGSLAVANAAKAAKVNNQERLGFGALAIAAMLLWPWFPLIL
jgi:hypothetical protein